MSYDDRFRGQAGHDAWGDDLDEGYDEGYDQPYAEERYEDSDAFVR